MRRRQDDVVRAIDRIPYWLNTVLRPASRWIERCLNLLARVALDRVP